MIADTAQLARTVRLIMELRHAGIGDARVLGAIEQSAARAFRARRSFRTMPMRMSRCRSANGQTISQPYVVALMTETLELGERHKVLEIGTGSGYQAAVLARLCRRVFTIERHRALVRAAEQRFKALRLDNIVSLFGDGTKGWPEQAPFDRIIVTAAAPEIPVALVEQLAPGGIMVLPVGDEYRDQQLVRVRRGEASYRMRGACLGAFRADGRGIAASRRYRRRG